MKIQALVFDFGNVLGAFDHSRATRRLADHAGVPAETIHAYLFGGALENDYELGKLSTAAYLEGFRRQFGFRCPDQVLEAAYADIFTVNEDVCALLPRLKPRYRLVLGSNTTDMHARQFRRQFAEHLRWFDAVVLSFEVGARKPAPAFYEHCRRRADCAANECLFIDDLPANVAGARAAGWQGIVFRDCPDLLRRFGDLGVVLEPPQGRLHPARRPGL